MTPYQWQVLSMLIVVCGLFVATVQLVTIYRNRK